MIISGGENIFPGEIERTLGDHPAIAESSCRVPHPDWGEVVKACVVTRPGQRADGDQVREYVGTNLASYKKPRIVEFLAEIRPRYRQSEPGRAARRRDDGRDNLVTETLAGKRVLSSGSGAGQRRRLFPGVRRGKRSGGPWPT